MQFIGERLAALSAATDTPETPEPLDKAADAYKYLHCNISTHEVQETIKQAFLAGAAAVSSNGQESGLSRRQSEFNSPHRYHSADSSRLRDNQSCEDSDGF